MFIPDSTYRVQVNNLFGFKDLLDTADYFHKLGIGCLYSSPIFKAKKGSMHGYDIVDPQQINPEVGTYQELTALRDKLREYNIGWLQDIVPNHMSYNYENQMLVDLLENGQNSRYNNFFDIEWNHPHTSVNQRLMAPFLGKFYQECLEQGELKLIYDQEGFGINYYEFRLPVRMDSYIDILSFRLPQLKNKLGKNTPDVIKYLGILYAVKSLPGAELLDERYDQIKFIKSILWELYSGNENIKVFIDESLKIYNGEPGNPESFNLLDKLLSAQYFRFCFWKVATEEINYRRFFNINELISLRIENEDTFSRTHTLIFRLIKEGIIDGLRIDHIDGLYDPAKYLQMLRARNAAVYIIVEKILEFEEKLPEDWPVQGTTGYEYLNYVSQLFCEQRNEKVFSVIYQKFLKSDMNYENLIHQKKNLIIKGRMAGEVERLAFIVEAISGKDRYGVDITIHAMRQALDEILTYFPVYRTYLNGDNYNEQDKSYLNQVISKSIEKNPRLVNEISYIGKLLHMEFGEHFSEEQKEKALDFVMRFQQLTGPLMAKGFEDTFLYVYNRLVSLNEVGGNPGKFGITADKFHQFNSERMEKWKYTLNASSTHDTKRSEDVRGRINVLSEIPSEWEEKIKYWNKINRTYKKVINDKNMPDRNDEYFLYQTLLGSLPFDLIITEDYKERIKNYIIKSVREAKIYTAWIKPDEEYETAYLNFVDKIFSPMDKNKFLPDLFQFSRKISHYGVFNSLSQLLLKITSPGIPDFYQGTELWDFSLVDPDNRRPVDYSARKKFLDEITGVKEEERNNFIRELLRTKEDGRIKLYLTYAGLKCRKEQRELFQEGEYIPLNVEGPRADNIIAFARKLNDRIYITAVPRFTVSLCSESEFPLGESIWKNTVIKLPENLHNLRNEITCSELPAGESITATDVFGKFPAALISAQEFTT